MGSFFPFFGLDGEETGWLNQKSRKPFGLVPIRSLVPNLVTLLSLCMGLTAIRMAIEGRYELAVACIIVAALLDSIDGRVARALKSDSRFGAELDSLVDLVSFGIAPVILMYSWSLKDLGSVGWIGVLCFSIATALRLARFNTNLDLQRPKWEAEHFFVGVPAPAGALTVMLPLYIDFLGVVPVQGFAFVTLIYVLAVAFMMVSKIPTCSNKMIGSRVPHDVIVPLLFSILIYVTLLLSYPWKILTISTLVYWVSIPFGVAHLRKLKGIAGSTGKEEETPSSFDPDEVKREDESEETRVR